VLQLSSCIEHVHKHRLCWISLCTSAIQARAGCACAGPYGHQLLKESLLAACGCSQKTILRDIDKLASAGNSWIKPGWVRVYFSYLMLPCEVDYIITSVLAVAQHGHKLLPLYQMDSATGLHCHLLLGFPAHYLVECVSFGLLVCATLSTLC
jgi:hypothetical protein